MNEEKGVVLISKGDSFFTVKIKSTVAQNITPRRSCVQNLNGACLSALISAKRRRN